MKRVMLLLIMSLGLLIPSSSTGLAGSSDGPRDLTAPAAMQATAPAPKVFVADRWRVTVIAAGSADLIPQAGLHITAGSVWLMVIADVTNWGNDDAPFLASDFSVQLSDAESPILLDVDATESAAAGLGIEPGNAGAGVQINANETSRVALVFATPDVVLAAALVSGSARLPLDGFLTENPADLSNLPALYTAPYLEAVKIAGVESGNELLVEADAGKTASLSLAGYLAPVGEECFADEATKRLKKLAGKSVLVEEGNLPFNVWRERPNGFKALINQEMIAGGYAKSTVETDSPYADWLAESERLAQEAGKGVWAGCEPASTSNGASTDSANPYDGFWGGPTSNHGSFRLTIENNAVTEFFFHFQCSDGENTGIGSEFGGAIVDGKFVVTWGPKLLIEGTFTSPAELNGTAHIDMTLCDSAVDLTFVGIKLP